jgi:hypothetical protein
VHPLLPDLDLSVAESKEVSRIATIIRESELRIETLYLYIYARRDFRAKGFSMAIDRNPLAWGVIISLNDAVQAEEAGHFFEAAQFYAKAADHIAGQERPGKGDMMWAKRLEERANQLLGKSAGNEAIEAWARKSLIATLMHVDDVYRACIGAENGLPKPRF